MLTIFPLTWLSSVLALCLLLVAPTSRRLDRRIAINVAVTVGWAQAALWLPPLLGSRTAVVASLAGFTGLVAAVAVAQPSALVPESRWRDAVMAAAGVLAALIALPLAAPRGADRALAMLSTGIDNSYHFAMFLEQRLAAADSPLLAANADSSGFAFSHHPQGFHQLMTVLAQTGFGDPARATTELIRYAQLQWLLFVLIAVMVTAALLQALPDHTPPSLLIPTIAILWSLVLGVPGAVNLLQGHLSFLLAASAPLVIFLLGSAKHRLSPVTFAAMAGLVLVAASWMLLLPLAGAAMVPTMVTVWRRQSGLTRSLSLAIAAVGATLAFVVFVYPWVFGAGLEAVVRDGSVARVGLPTMVPLLVGAVAALAALRRRWPGCDLGPHLLLATVSLLQMVVLGGYLHLTTGELTYYFWKLGLASLLVSIVVTVHALVTVRVDVADARGRSSSIRPLAAMAITLAAALGLGSVLQQFAAPSAAWAAIMPVSVSARATSGDAGDVATVLALAERWVPTEAARVSLLATRPDDMNAAHAAEWFHALSHSATRDAVSVDHPVYMLAEDRSNVELAVSITAVELARPGRMVAITDPGLYRAVIASTTPADANRVILVSGADVGD